MWHIQAYIDLNGDKNELLDSIEEVSLLVKGLNDVVINETDNITKQNENKI